MTGEQAGERRARELRALVGAEDVPLPWKLQEVRNPCLLMRARPCGMLERLMWTD